jgi:hypothetical protein
MGQDPRAGPGDVPRLHLRRRAAVPVPNLNSIAVVSLVGATAAVAYCTVFWVVSVAKGRVAGVAYDPVKVANGVDGALGILNGLGIIAFAFRGHNLALEIQVNKKLG